MRQERDELRRQFDPGDDRRVTRLGRLLRKTKLDELPELFNVVLGDMSIVGPRPEVEKYVSLFRKEYDVILKVRPGLSDLASIKYRNEEEILASRVNSEKYYIDEILPDKLKLAKEYLENISFKADIYIVLETIKSIL
jgi:lipopolysaccharide/colanic/teichoic acid biosynthesis glycosyltransferase